MSRRSMENILVLLIGSAAALLLCLNAPAARAQPDPRYYTYDEINALFDNWAATYPNIFRREILGYSGVGHEPIWAAEISRNPGAREAEPSLLFHAAQHSNEANGTGAIVYMMGKILTRYGQDPRYTAMVDSLQMWFVPILNVDGHRMCFGGGPNWRDWRKTNRDNNGDGQYTYPADGVDTNRNWDFDWASYDSTNYGSDYYKGPYPFSEPETTALRDFILREWPVIIMDYHSPGEMTRPNDVFWTWFNDQTGRFSVDQPFYQRIATSLAHTTFTETGAPYGSFYGFNTLPKEQNWIYANTGICTLIMEISTACWWQGALVDTIAARVGRGSFYLMDRARSGPGLTGAVTDSMTGAPLTADVEILEAQDPTIGPRLTDPRLGRYWRLLIAGTYTAQVTAAGYHPASRSVSIGLQGWTEADFRLQPITASAPGGGPSIPGITLEVENPTLSAGTVRIRTSGEAQVMLDLYDVTGRRLRSLVNGRLAPGAYPVQFGDGLPSGVYLLSLRASGQEVRRKIVIGR